MTSLFTFTSHGELFALPGDEVREVLRVEATAELTLEQRGAFARRGNVRLPVLRMPGEEHEGTDAADVTLLHVAPPRTSEGYLPVESAGGLVDVEEVVPLPPYLFPEGAPAYAGLFRLGDRTGALIRSEALEPRRSPSES